MKSHQVGLRHLRAFLAVAECGSIRQAATRLNISQPPLGRTIQGVEHSLGVKLFERSRTGLRLTTAGQELYVKVRDIVQELDSVLVSTSDANLLEEIRIEMSDDTFFGELGDAIHEFCRGKNTYRYSISLEFSGKIIESVVAKRADVGVVVAPVLSPYSELMSFSLAPVPLYVVVPAGHKLAERRGVFVKDLPKDEIVLAQIDRQCGFVLKLQALGFAADYWSQVVKVWPSQLGVELVKSGRGITILSEEAVPRGLEGVKLLPILDEGAAIQRSVIWRTGCSPATKALVQHLRKIANRHEPPRESV